MLNLDPKIRFDGICDDSEIHCNTMNSMTTSYIRIKICYSGHSSLIHVLPTNVNRMRKPYMHHQFGSQYNPHALTLSLLIHYGLVNQVLDM